MKTNTTLKKLKKRKQRSRKSFRKQRSGKVNGNTLLVGLAIILLIVMGRDVLNALAKKFGFLDVTPETKEIIVYRDRVIKAPPVTVTQRDVKEINKVIAREGGAPVSIESKHRIPVPRPAPGRNVEQFGYIVRGETPEEDGSYRTDLIIKYDVKLIFGFSFKPIVTVGFDGKNLFPGLGSTFFQIYRFEASGHVATKYAALGASFIIRKETSLGLGYGLFYGKTTPKVVLFAKVGI